MTEYVCGFMVEGGVVALIRKKRPAWQAGRLNGIGGHIEPGETPAEAMAREFREETGLATQPGQWIHRVTVTGDVWKVYFFLAYGPTAALVTKTDEPVEVVPLWNVPMLSIIPNLKWLIPLCLQSNIRGPVEIHDDMVGG